MSTQKDQEAGLKKSIRDLKIQNYVFAMLMLGITLFQVYKIFFS